MTRGTDQATLQKGFIDPVDGAGQTFRAILDVLSRPGTVVDIQGPSETPDALSGGASAVLLTMADYVTPVWLDPSLVTDSVQAYIRFHTNAPITRTPNDAVFAVLSSQSTAFDVEAFNPGTQQYPDRATTLIIEVNNFEDGPAVELQGPGIDGRTTFQADGLPENFWAEMQRNNARFPLGVDVIFAAPGKLAALPRSTLIKVI